MDTLCNSCVHTHVHVGQTDGYIHISPLPKGEAETVKFGTSTKGGNVSILTENTVSHVLYRSQEEKFQDPSRLSLDRRNFVTIPIFEVRVSSSCT